jgi:hypothetical protein
VKGFIVVFSEILWMKRRRAGYQTLEKQNLEDHKPSLYLHHHPNTPPDQGSAPPVIQPSLPIPAR